MAELDDPVLSMRDLLIAAPLSERRFQQGVLRSRELTVTRRCLEAGGGVLLRLRDETGRTTELVFNEAGRDRLVELLSGPVVPPCVPVPPEAE